MGNVTINIIGIITIFLCYFYSSLLQFLRGGLTGNLLRMSTAFFFRFLYVLSLAVIFFFTVRLVYAKCVGWYALRPASTRVRTCRGLCLKYCTFCVFTEACMRMFCLTVYLDRQGVEGLKGRER